MFTELLNSTCDIYRLSGRDDHDFTLSDEGEVAETWSAIASSVPCRVNRFATDTRRATPGLVEQGGGLLFLKIGTDIEDRDRVLVNSKWYVVLDVETIEGMTEDHHMECTISLIHWKS